MFLIIGILENAHDIRTSEKRRLNNSMMPFKTIDIRRSQWVRRLRGDWKAVRQHDNCGYLQVAELRAVFSYISVIFLYHLLFFPKIEKDINNISSYPF